MHVNTNQPLPVVRVGEIKSEESAQRWLVDGLWGASSVGVIGGAPKRSKTWLGSTTSPRRGKRRCLMRHVVMRFGSMPMM